MKIEIVESETCFEIINSVLNNACRKKCDCISTDID